MQLRSWEFWLAQLGSDGFFLALGLDCWRVPEMLTMRLRRIGGRLGRRAIGLEADLAVRRFLQARLAALQSNTAVSSAG